MTWRRAFAILASIQLVGAFALAILVSPDLPLGRALALLDGGQPEGVRHFFETNLPLWSWTRIALPVLARPAWLLPAMLGVVFGGLAVSVRHGGAPRTWPRRGN